ncbi:replicative DNA helicase [Bacillus phage vB_BanS-Thrax3]|nr:replicative DNA helicase [Bacillus phage vB_BanS-Thrax3]
MAQDNTKEIVIKELKKINGNAKINEAYFVGLLWADPFNHFAEYSDTVSQDEFVHDVWGFYFELGRLMYKESIRKFDRITVATKVKEYNLIEEFEEFGGMDTIEDAIEIVKDNPDNIDYYYETVKKNYVIKQLYLLFGNKVLIKKGKYDFEKMTSEQLGAYWDDKMNIIRLNNVNRYEAENLYIDPKEFMKKLREESAEMLPFYKSKILNSITQGVARGHVNMFGGFGGTGKSSITAEKVIMSCIANGEKAIVVLNEEDAQAFRQKIMLTLLWHEFGEHFDRKRFISGNLRPEDEEKITKAFNRMNELMDGDEALIKVVFMEKYVIKDLEKIVRFWANRGYINLIIDTHKVSDESQFEQRWQTFVEDMKVIYRLTRKNAGGLNLRTWVTFQLADSAIRNRYLDFEAIGEGKASKNEASVVMMFRKAWSDEYAGGKNELTCYQLKRIGDTDEFEKVFFTLQEGKQYYLLFVPKNRFGQANDTGLPVIVIEPYFQSNTFREIGRTFVANDNAKR